MKRTHRRPSTVLSRALLAAFLASIPGSREALAQTLGRAGATAPVSAGVGAAGASLGGLSAAPGLSTTLSPASLSLTPLSAAIAAPAALTPAAALVPAAAKAILVSAAAQSKTLAAPALGGGDVKSAAAKSFDGSGGKGSGDSSAPAFVPSALSPRLSAPAAEFPDTMAPTPLEIVKIRGAIKKNHELGDVLNRSSIVKLVSPSVMPFTRVFAAVEELAARGELARLSDGMYVRTDASAREGAGEGDLKLAHNQVMAGVRLLNQRSSVNHTLAVATLGDALKLLTLIEAPAPLRAEVTALFNNAVLEMTRDILAEYRRYLTETNADPAGVEFTRITAARDALKGRASAVDSPEPELFNKEMGAWLAEIFDKISFLPETRTEGRGEALDAGIALYQAFHRRAPAGSKEAADGSLDSIEGLKTKMAAIGMPAAIQEITAREFEKLAQMNPKDSEAQKIRTYIEWLTDVPWGKRTEDATDIAAARAGCSTGITPV